MGSASAAGWCRRGGPDAAYEEGTVVKPPEQRMLIDLARDYLNVPVPEHRAAIAALARALAEENVQDT
jgi:hypothetical protein